MLFVVLCPGNPEGSTGSGSDFKASQKTGQRLKVSSDRLGEARNRTCDPWFTRHRFIPYTTAASHLSVFGTEAISSDNRSIDMTDISDTLLLLYFLKKMPGHQNGMNISESALIRIHKRSKDRTQTTLPASRCGKGAHGK